MPGWTDAAVGALAGALLVWAVANWRAQALRQRLERLRRATEAAARGEAPSLEEGDDAPGRLARAIRELHEAIVAFQSERDQIDAQAAKRADAMAVLVSEMDQLAYATSHDLMTPLRGIEQLVGFIDEDLRGVASPETREHLMLLRARVQRMSMLLASIREYAEVSASDVDVEYVDVGALIRRVVGDLGLPSSFTVYVPENAPTLQTAESRLERVLGIVIGNAARHHDGEAGTVQIAIAQTEDSQLEFTIADDGPGIPRANQRRVFMMFRTLQRRDERDTAGMGLPLAKKIVEKAGGVITLQSPIDGARGTLIRFTWPRMWATGPDTVVRMFKASKTARQRH